MDDYKQNEMNNIIKQNIDNRSITRLKNPTFQKSDPICQGKESRILNEVNKKTILK